jgi:hypothetical protein
MEKKTSSSTKMDDQASASPKAQENLVRIFIDPQLTRGGLRTFDATGGSKLYIGWVNVSQDIAEDLQRRIDEIREIHDAMMNPRQKIRIKNFEVIERQFLADPEAYEKRKGWSKEFGLLDPWQWQHLTKVAQERLINTRKQLYPHLYQ